MHARTEFPAGLLAALGVHTPAQRVEVFFFRGSNAPVAGHLAVHVVLAALSQAVQSLAAGSDSAHVIGALPASHARLGTCALASRVPAFSGKTVHGLRYPAGVGIHPHLGGDTLARVVAHRGHPGVDPDDAPVIAELDEPWAARIAEAHACSVVVGPVALVVIVVDGDPSGALYARARPLVSVGHPETDIEYVLVQEAAVEFLGAYPIGRNAHRGFAQMNQCNVMGVLVGVV